MGLGRAGPARGVEGNVAPGMSASSRFGGGACGGAVEVVEPGVPGCSRQILCGRLAAADGVRGSISSPEAAEAGLVAADLAAKLCRAR